MKKFLRMEDLVELTRLSESTIRRLIKDGDFPPPRKISKGCVGWWSDEIEEWIETRPVTKEPEELVAGV